MTLWICAQRRPGLHPGVTPGRPFPGRERSRRSTKAGVSAPATHDGPQEPVPPYPRSTKGRRLHVGDTPPSRPVGTRLLSLNEDQGLHPGDMGVPLPLAGRPPNHSTKAGACTPATQHRPPDAGRVVQRSTKAGTRTPATPGWGAWTGSRSAPLNEGRGIYPGDTRRGSRPGTRPCALNEGRGFHPGDTPSERSRPGR